MDEMVWMGARPNLLLPGHFCAAAGVVLLDMPLFSNNALLRATVSLSLIALPSDEHELSRENVCRIAERVIITTTTDKNESCKKKEHIHTQNVYNIIHDYNDC